MIKRISILKKAKYLDLDKKVIVENAKILRIEHNKTIDYVDMMNRVNLNKIAVMNYKREILLYVDSTEESSWI